MRAREGEDTVKREGDEGRGVRRDLLAYVRPKGRKGGRRGDSCLRGEEERTQNGPFHLRRGLPAKRWAQRCSQMGQQIAFFNISKYFTTLMESTICCTK